MSDAGGITAEQLKAYFERIEWLEDEKGVIAANIKNVFAEAKANGFDVKVMRDVLRLRKMDSDDRAEHAAILDLYMSAVGMAPAS